MVWSSDEEEDEDEMRMAGDDNKGDNIESQPSQFNAYSKPNVAKRKRQDTEMLIVKGQGEPNSAGAQSTSAGESSGFEGKKPRRDRRETQMEKINAQDEERRFARGGALKTVESETIMRQEDEMENAENEEQMPAGFGDDDDSEDGDIFGQRGAGNTSKADSDADEFYKDDGGNDVFGQESEYERNANESAAQKQRRKETLIF